MLRLQHQAVVLRSAAKAAAPLSGARTSLQPALAQALPPSPPSPPAPPRFFEDYKKNENKVVVVDEFLGREDAHRIIQEAMDLYQVRGW